ncbi:MAG: GNAT family N-acetyltransferase [Candidatus Lokiarchaeota archaeon]|nr:GNAT family N-acetyltransferase [Candidatus Lokiarchaeota archaeon]
MSSINIRRFKKPDIESAKKLMIQLCELTGTEFLEERFLWGLKMRLYDALKKNGMLIAEEDIGDGKPRVIGFLLADINIEPTGTSTGYIRTVIIDESARGKGVGKELVAHAINYLKTMDVDSILVNVRAATQTARKLYENLGFQELYRVMEYPVSNKKKEDLKLPDNYMDGAF